MIITDLVVRKMDHADERYPDLVRHRHLPFSDVYLLTATLDDGTQQECPCFVLDDYDSGKTTQLRAANMLRFFASAIEKMERAEVA